MSICFDNRTHKTKAGCMLPCGNNLICMYKKYLKMICIFKLFKILFKGFDRMTHLTQVERKISHWDYIESLPLLMLSFIYLINPLLFFISFLNCTTLQQFFYCPNIKILSIITLLSQVHIRHGYPYVPNTLVGHCLLCCIAPGLTYQKRAPQ